MWKACSEKYEASTDGHIRNTKTKRVLKEFPGKDGYIKGDAQYGGLALAKKFGVAHQTVCAVVSGQNWSR